MLESVPCLMYYQGLRYRIGGRRYRLRRSDILALRLLQKIRMGQPARSEPTWLLRFRSDIRQIRDLQPRAALSLVAATAADSSTRNLALWLRGLCGGCLAAPQLLSIALHSPVEQQVLFARSFQKMGAWAQIRELAKIPELAACHARFLKDQVPRDFHRRLQRFVSHTPRVETSGVQSPLFCTEEVRENRGKPAKPLWLIRLVLDRIRWLVSSEESLDRLPQHFAD